MGGDDCDADLSAASQTDHDDNSGSEINTATSQPLAASVITREKPKDNTHQFDCAAFNKLMWDDGGHTTTSDKERWIYECITTTFIQTNGDVPPATVPANPCPDVHPNPLEIFTGSYIGSSGGEELNIVSPQQLWGFTQKHGGPCGILAALQAELIRILLFGRRDSRGSDGRSFYFPFSPRSPEDSKVRIAKPLTPSEVNESLAMAIGMVLARASIMPCVSKDVVSKYRGVRLVLPKRDNNPGWIEEMLSDTSSTSTTVTDLGLKLHIISDTLDSKSNGMSPAKRPRNEEVQFAIGHQTPELSPQQRRMAELAGRVADYLLDLDDKIAIPLEVFQQPGSIMFFVMSLAETRGVDRIRADMDDPLTTMSLKFGHSSQELINLTLTGQAVSNTFDNSMNLSESDDFRCHGIQSIPMVGYLTMLESLRYCEVGSYYKNPKFPIWVIGSTSHFSVLFGDDRCLKESKSDLLLEQCRRAFKKIEGGDESGFIQVDKLGKVLDELGLGAKLGGDSGVQTLQAYLEVSGAGIILWDSFWQAISRIMTGSSLQTIIDCDGDGPPPLLLCNGEIDDSMVDNKPAATSTLESSDEALARKLAAEFGSAPNQVFNKAVKSDEDFARELQEEFNREAGVTTLGISMDVDSQGATADMDDLPSLSSSPRASSPVPLLEPVKIEVMTDNSHTHLKTQQRDFEKYGNSFPLYYYNGLSGGKLTPLKLTRLSPTEAVGASIAISSKGGGHGGDLEDVLRTKWPSCVIDWLGKTPPSID